MALDSTLKSKLKKLWEDKISGKSGTITLSSQDLETLSQVLAELFSVGTPSTLPSIWTDELVGSLSAADIIFKIFVELDPKKIGSANIKHLIATMSFQLASMHCLGTDEDISSFISTPYGETFATLLKKRFSKIYFSNADKKEVLLRRMTTIKTWYKTNIKQEESRKKDLSDSDTDDESFEGSSIGQPIDLSKSIRGSSYHPKNRTSTARRGRNLDDLTPPVPLPPIPTDDLEGSSSRPFGKRPQSHKPNAHHPENRTSILGRTNKPNSARQNRNLYDLTTPVPLPPTPTDDLEGSSGFSGPYSANPLSKSEKGSSSPEKKTSVDLSASIAATDKIRHRRTNLPKDLLEHPDQYLTQTVQQDILNMLKDFPGQSNATIKSIQQHGNHSLWKLYHILRNQQEKATFQQLATNVKTLCSLVTFTPEQEGDFSAFLISSLLDGNGQIDDQIKNKFAEIAKKQKEHADGKYGFWVTAENYLQFTVSGRYYGRPDNQRGGKNVTWLMSQETTDENLRTLRKVKEDVKNSVPLHSMRRAKYGELLSITTPKEYNEYFVYVKIDLKEEEKKLNECMTGCEQLRSSLRSSLRISKKISVKSEDLNAQNGNAQNDDETVSIEIPSNETPGANDQWVPGGITLGGLFEYVGYGIKRDPKNETAYLFNDPDLCAHPVSYVIQNSRSLNRGIFRTKTQESEQISASRELPPQPPAKNVWAKGDLHKSITRLPAEQDPSKPDTTPSLKPSDYKKKK